MLLRGVPCSLIVTVFGSVLAQNGPVNNNGVAKSIVEERDWYSGKVLAVDSKSITLLSPGWNVIQMIVPPGGGKSVGQIEKVIPPQPPRKFKGCDILAAGKASDAGGASTAYRLSDVKVGERVDIAYNRTDGVDIVEQISIMRRPGGRVPPSPIERRNSPFKHHERMNAYQDLEERGIPLAEKWLPQTPPWAIAPAPREAHIKIPEAAP